MKVVINRCHGGFDVSHKGVMRYAELVGIPIVSVPNRRVGYHYYKMTMQEWEETNSIEDKKKRENILNDAYFYATLDVKRDDPHLVQVVEELGSEAYGTYSELKVVEIPDDIEWEIFVDDSGIEIVREKSRSWG